MATARISQEFADESAFQVEVEVDDQFPDSVAEVCTQAMKLWAAAFTEADTHALDDVAAEFGVDLDEAGE